MNELLNRLDVLERYIVLSSMSNKKTYLESINEYRTILTNFIQYTEDADLDLTKMSSIGVRHLNNINKYYNDLMALVRNISNQIRFDRNIDTNTYDILSNQSKNLFMETEIAFGDFQYAYSRRNALLLAKRESRKNLEGSYIPAIEKIISETKLIEAKEGDVYAAQYNALIEEQLKKQRELLASFRNDADTTKNEMAQLYNGGSVEELVELDNPVELEDSLVKELETPTENIIVTPTQNPSEEKTAVKKDEDKKAEEKGNNTEPVSPVVTPEKVETTVTTDKTVEQKNETPVVTPTETSKETPTETPVVPPVVKPAEQTAVPDGSYGLTKKDIVDGTYHIDGKETSTKNTTAAPTQKPVEEKPEVKVTITEDPNKKDMVDGTYRIVFKKASEETKQTETPVVSPTPTPTEKPVVPPVVKPAEQTTAPDGSYGLTKKDIVDSTLRVAPKVTPTPVKETNVTITPDTNKEGMVDGTYSMTFKKPEEKKTVVVPPVVPPVNTEVKLPNRPAGMTSTELPKRPEGMDAVELPKRPDGMDPVELPKRPEGMGPEKGKVVKKEKPKKKLLYWLGGGALVALASLFLTQCSSPAVVQTSQTQNEEEKTNSDDKDNNNNNNGNNWYPSDDGGNNGSDYTPTEEETTPPTEEETTPPTEEETTPPTEEETTPPTEEETTPPTEEETNIPDQDTNSSDFNVEVGQGEVVVRNDENGNPDIEITYDGSKNDLTDTGVVPENPVDLVPTDHGTNIVTGDDLQHDPLPSLGDLEGGTPSAGTALEDTTQEIQTEVSAGIENHPEWQDYFASLGEEYLSDTRQP